MKNRTQPPTDATSVIETAEAPIVPAETPIVPAETAETPAAETPSAEATIPALPLAKLFGIYQVKPWQQAVYRSYWAAVANAEERPDLFEARLEEALSAPVGRRTPGQTKRQATRVDRADSDRLRALRGLRGDA